jgi:hypothetical protein
MAEGFSPKPDETSRILPPEAAKEVLEKRLEQVPPQELIAQVFAAVSRTTIGPDPETARILAQAEMHAESSKLEAYKENLKNRDNQNGRDHDYRCKKLVQDSFNLKIVLFCALAGCIGGIVLMLTGHQTLGSNLLLASALAVYGIMGGKTPFMKDKD